ncbi:hypothetical protein KAFR_0B05330 [Kazachstania africana CBS 2517]|uniref:Protein Ste5 Fus3-binding domain-containing protein n=1 Tax=Kazachstania africana (strain ATCC 22294 / BCRC 22015 / CBS 2517 / CECT 1963 / NBRC 1671 / NRRL Y-8276) TaxID=1071382 RepID=H2AR28_KAZAF|nr:hypothetical protein KAFR_0B05330 [Kazachstania africana CBS 2517]CCF56828.1 hypothetical protein KAFR_0B05330 [Kazachstania africana CBS 2517]
MSQTPKDSIPHRNNRGSLFLPYTPLTTPRLNSTLSSANESFEDSPSSTKSKTWKGKFSKFQRSSARKKKNESPSSAFTFSPITRSATSLSPSNNIITTPSTSHPDNHPFRTSSLPRPNSQLFNSGSRSVSNALSESKGLRDEVPISSTVPFGLPVPSASEKKSFLNACCTLCEEPISNRTNGERVIELVCRHLIHQECLCVSFETSAPSNNSDMSSNFPECSKCLTERQRTVKCVPKNDEIMDKLVSEFLIKRSFSDSPTLTHPQFSLSTPIISPIPSPVQQIERQSLIQPTPVSTLGSLAFPLQDAPATRSRMTPLGNTNRFSFFPSSHNRDASLSSKSTRGTDFSVLHNSLNNTSNSFLSNENVPVPLLRSYFLEAFLSKHDKVPGWKLDSLFGLLRLVDRLMVSTDGKIFKECWCYLFEHGIIIAFTDESKSVTNSDNIVLEATFTNIKMFAPIVNIKVDTVESSVLKCTISQHNKSENDILFLTETLNTDSSQIIQKWISGLLDPELSFNEYNFTSTLPLPPVMKNISQNDASSDTFTGLISSNKILELTSMENKHGSVMIRRGLTLPNDENTIDNMATMMTTISSILSLKRERPDDLVIIFQIDFFKVKNNDDILNFYNILKALLLKFPECKFCAVNTAGFIIDYGLITEKVEGPDYFQVINKVDGTIKFEPTWLKSLLFPQEIRHNVAIVIVSNSSMEADKSCLLMDYNPFASNGRRRPNELKVKVGYLNIDYSDKINELIEIDSWSVLLEALCYSFTLNFDEDEGSEYDESTDSTSVSDAQSLTTLQISTPINNGNSDSLSPLELGQELKALTVNGRTAKASGKSEISDITKPAKPLNTDASLNNALLNDIDKAIAELNRDDLLSPTTKNSSEGSIQSEFYGYL